MKFSFLKNNTLFFILFVGLAFTACDDDDDDMDDIVNEPQSISVELAQDPNFTILTAALNKAGLYDDLTDGTYTIFAPSDRAFIAAGITNLDLFTASYLESLLQYHVINDEVTYSELEDGAVETMNGDFYLSRVNDRPYINGDVEFTQIDYNATNGIIHVVNEVIFPPANTITDLVTEDPGLSTLEAALQKAGLQSTLEGNGPYTIFAPTNAAFSNLFQTLGISGLDEISATDLETYLKYHVVSDRKFSTELEEGSQSTLADEDLNIYFSRYIVLEDKNADTENAIILAGNRIATNGVVHKIDRVMLPE